jgi:hypothetical protein
MSNIPGATNVLPGIFTDVVTESRGTAVAGGLRVPAIMGEGITNQTIVSSAVGNGKDGLNSKYTSTSGADGRHFVISLFPVISNRTTLYRNGVPLTGIEQVINDQSFSNKYDYRFDPDTGRIEMQSAYLQDLGGDYYSPFSTNKGDGYISSDLTLQDSNAPQETWSVRCVSVTRDNANKPVAGTAKFIAVGSVSGNKVDSNGNPIIWTSNGETFSNGILSFAIYQTTGGNPFTVGDGFTIKVSSGRLSPNDSLTASYIVTGFLNNGVSLQGLEQVVSRYGSPSTSNTLSLGAQLAFANAASSIVAVQCAPPVPRRTSILLSDKVQSDSDLVDDFIFPLPLNFTPDLNSNIHFFVTNNATGEETQILPNKQPFYTVGTGSGTSPSFSHFTGVDGSSEFSFYYSVFNSEDVPGGDYQDGVIKSGFDGYIARDTSSASGDKGIFSVLDFNFTANYVGKKLKIIDSSNVANNAKYTVTSVAGGKLYATVIADSYENFEAATSLAFEIIDPLTGLVVDGYSGTDGVLSPSTSSVAHLSSASVDFSHLGDPTTKRIRINTAGMDHGLFDITAFDGVQTLTIKKSVVIESNLNYFVFDSDETTNYVIINKDVVPNGYALRVTVIDEKDASFYDAGWINALEGLEKTNVDIVVPLPTATPSVIFQNTLNHCITMSNIRNRKERVLFIGAISGLNPANLIGSASDGTNTPVAVEDIGILEGIQGDDPTEKLSGNIEDIANYSVSDAFGGTYRCVYFYPDQIVVQAGTENVLVDGFYIAAAAAGYLGGQPRVEIPLTNRVLSGFTILNTKIYSQLTLESLAASGVTTLQPVAGGGKVLWGITTTQSGFAEEQEISIVFIRDRIAKTFRSSFAGYVGLPETSTTGATLGNHAINVLNAFINQGLITAYADLSVQRDSVDPRQWNIRVKVQPTYPVNWIYIRVGVGTI